MRLYQRGKSGTWWVDLGEAGGQRARRSLGTSDKRQAQEAAAHLAGDLWRHRKLGEAPRVTWDVAVLAWLEEHQHRRSIEDIKRVLRWLSERLQGVALADITGERIRALARERRQQLVHGQQTSGATVNRHMAQLSAVLHYAHRRGWLAAVPPISKAPEPGKRVAWLTHVQAGTPLAVLQELGGWASLAMVQKYAHLGQQHTAAWAGNALAAPGTNPAQAAADAEMKNAPGGAFSWGGAVGWLKGLEPSTTGITIREQAGSPSKIKHIPKREKPKAA